MQTMTSFIIGLFMMGTMFNSEPYYHSVPVAQGDGVISLLRRYALTEHDCNLNQFYKLNNLESKDPLLKGVKYKIPVLIYAYNGQSIRSSIGINDWDKAVRIQKYNETLLASGLRKTHYRESKILWVPFNEIHCDNQVSEVTNKVTEAHAVTSSNKMYDPLFGNEYAEFEIVDNSLKDKVFYIVAGHGGPDPGAVANKVNGKYNLCEDEYAYDVSLRLSRQLKQRGAIVHMIIEDRNDGIRDDLFLDCDKDETCQGKKIPLGQLDRLRQRAVSVNNFYKHYKKKGIADQRVICIHVDSRGEHKRQDVFFYYYGKSRLGKKLAKNLHKTFQEKYQKYQSNRGYHGTLSARPLYMLRRTDAPAVYVELANIRNSKDRERLVKKDNREALAKWLAEGISK